MLILKWLNTFGRYIMLMGRTFSVPERFRMFWKQYVKEMVAEADAAYMIVLEASAAGGMFTISFSHRFIDDAYLDAFLDELRGQNLTCEIADRHPLQLAPIAGYRKIK